MALDHTPTHHTPMRVSGWHNPQRDIIGSAFTFMMDTEGARLAEMSRNGSLRWRSGLFSA
jgi:hypothetical protein